ncbi:hypothetical protein EAH73_22840, partial [Hymenobacter nivis]
QEPVLGYVGAHITQQKRIFIARTELPLPSDVVFDSPYQGCAVDSMSEVLFPFDPKGPHDPYTRLFDQPGTVPVSYYLTRSKLKMAYIGASTTCADCRLRGANVKPSFW